MMTKNKIRFLRMSWILMNKKSLGLLYHCDIGLRALRAVKQKTLNTPLGLWMTEYCVLKKYEDFVSSGRDFGINTALCREPLVHAYLSLANANALQWFLAVSPYGYKDGIMFIDKIKKYGKIYGFKRPWILVNYSRFTKSGYKRIGLKCTDRKTTKKSLQKFLLLNYMPQSREQYIAIFESQSVSLKAKRWL
jgi:hypothetical protein